MREAYLPVRVICLKCGQDAEFDRRHDCRTNRRHVVVRHHGEQTQIPLCDAPGQTVEAFAA